MTSHPRRSYYKFRRCENHRYSVQSLLEPENHVDIDIFVSIHLSLLQPYSGSPSWLICTFILHLKASFDIRILSFVCETSPKISSTWLSFTVVYLNINVKFSGIMPWMCVGAWGTAPCILNLGTLWNCLVIFRYRPLYSRRKSSPYQLNRKLSEPLSRSELFMEQKNLPLLGVEPLFLCHPVHS